MYQQEISGVVALRVISWTDIMTLQRQPYSPLHGVLCLHLVITSIELVT